jgi:SNF2 family DNA or RNA helicase
MQEVPFTPVLEPLEHQVSILSESGRRAEYGLFWEQGTGKTKSLIDNAALLLCEGAVDAALVLAPNGVHRNWVVEELPKHWPADLPPVDAFSWSSPSATSKWHQEGVKRLLGSNGFVWLCMSYDALMTDAGKQASWELLRSRRVLYILDESQRAKTPAAKRTKRIIASSVYAPYRRVASGTPMDKPFDIYSQVRFLDPDFWVREFGIGSFTSFKAYFGEWMTVKTNAGAKFDMCKAYRNLDELERALKKIGQRVLKDDVLDLPGKTYKRLFHELSPAQRRAYDEVRTEALTFLDSGELVTAELALVRVLRLQQITSGFITPKAGARPVPFATNPRAALLREILEDLTRPAIIWARFVEDVRVAAEASRAAGRRPVVFDGDRPELSVDVFHAGEADDIIANLESGMTEGFTLNEADTTVYFSNHTKLIKRKQSEDRNHRIGQTRSVTYIDLLAEGTLDVNVLTTLREKGSAVGQVLGDKETDWLLESRTPSDMLREWIT